MSRPFARPLRVLPVTLALLIVLAPPGEAQEPNGGDPGGWKAAGRSLLLPGWGQHSQGRPTLGYVLEGIEAAGWLGVWGWNRYRAWRRADSRRWAAAAAGADIAGKDGRWFEALEDFPDLITYNAFQRSGLGDPALAYAEGAGYEWRWMSESAWHRYRGLRRLARVAQNLTRVAAGGIVAVRLTGAVAALMTARRDDGGTGSPDLPAGTPHLRKGESAPGIRLIPWWESTPDGISAGLVIRW
jgi:hypothetical protein